MSNKLTPHEQRIDAAAMWLYDRFFDQVHEATLFAGLKPTKRNTSEIIDTLILHVAGVKVKS